MSYRYEYNEEPDGLIDSIGEALLGDFPTVYRCTIYDEDTDEELATGLGNSRAEAKMEAEDKL